MDPEVFELNAHSELCANQAYCLNGGTCYRLAALGRLYCECPDSFEGERCHLKTVGIPDWDMAQSYEKIFFRWNGLLPIAIVVAVAILVMVVLFCIYVCSKKCYQKYHITSPVKILRYQNASAQTSISQLYLLGGAETHCNGRLVSAAMITTSRTRLTACSTTPDKVDDSLHSLNESQRSCLDLESGGEGSCSEADLLEQGHAAATRPTIVVTTESDATEARHGFRRGAAAAESTPTRSKRTTNDRQGTSAPCLSPNDSNNNTDVLACNSSRRVTDPDRANCDERTTLLSQPGNCNLNNCVRDSDSTNNKSLNSAPSELYDSDPEATAL